MSGILNSTQKLLTGVDAHKQQNRMDDYNQQMQQMIGRQTSAYDQAMPQYHQVLDYFANRAGLAPPRRRWQCRTRRPGTTASLATRQPTPTKYAGTNRPGAASLSPSAHQQL
jgi:hypothetical protein